MHHGTCHAPNTACYLISCPEGFACILDPHDGGGGGDDGMQCMVPKQSVGVGLYELRPFGRLSRILYTSISTCGH